MNHAWLIGMLSCINMGDIPMLNKDQETVVDLFKEGCVTLSELGDALRMTGIDMQGLKKVEGVIYLNLVRETDRIHKDTGWPVLEYWSVELF
jgi:hypothetical protein